MAYDTTYTEYHLTPRGWIHGAWAVDEPPTDTSPPLEDCIEIWLQVEATNDTYPGKPAREWKLLWASDQYSKEEREQLRAKARKSVVTDPNGTTHLCWHFPS